MLDSVKNDFSVDFKGNKLTETPSIQADTTSLETVGKIGNRFSQNLPTFEVNKQFELPTLDLRSQDTASLSKNVVTNAPTVTADIKKSLAKESSSWQGGLLGNEAVSTTESLIDSRRALARAKSKPSSLSQKQLDNATGTFVVGKSGTIKLDYLFDGSTKEGELAIFNLKGMGGLSKRDFTREAARRALSGGQNGQIVIKDKLEGAQFGGTLGEKSRSKGKRASTKTVSLKPGTRFGLMLVPKGTISNARSGKGLSLFSISNYNPKGKTIIGKARDSVFAMEDGLSSRFGDDFNDVVFRLRGASDKVTNLSKLISPQKNWLKSANQPFLKGPSFSPNEPAEPAPTPAPGPTGQPKQKPAPAPIPGPIDTPKPIPPAAPIPSPPGPKSTSSISTNTSKFNPGSSEAEIIASGARKITLGSQRIYIGTQQITSINQNPIIRSFDSKNPKNNWTRTDIETTGTDGRGLGLFWSGKGLYGVFSVDGTQGSSSQDFRRATGGATQNWLKSYGTGGGSKIAVIGQIDPNSGKLLKAAHLSAVLSSGKTNSLSVTGASLNKAGNLVIKAKSFFSPRRPDGKALTQNPGSKTGSPFDYTLEITPDLSKVVRTSAPGWS